MDWIRRPQDSEYSQCLIVIGLRNESDKGIDTLRIKEIKGLASHFSMSFGDRMYDAFLMRFKVLTTRVALACEEKGTVRESFASALDEANRVRRIFS